MTAQGQTERAAWEGEMFRLLAENVKDYAIFVVDPHRHILSWSKGAERLLGFTEEEIIGRQCDSFFTPEDVERGVPQKELEQALASGRGEDDRWHMRKDGSRFWASGAVTPLKDEAGGLRGFAKIMRDRTEMRRAEEAAHERERQLQLLTDHAPVLIAHYDNDRRYKFVNKPFAARFGLHPREIVGKPIRDVLGEKAYGAIERHIETVLAGERVEFEAEVPYAGQGPQVMRCAYDPELDGEGRVVGFVAALVNVTEGRRAREALRESEERLRTLSDNLPHGAVYQVLGDREGQRQFLYISAGVEGLIGVTPAEALADANSLYGLVHEEDRPRLAAAEAVALRDTAPFDCEFRSWTRTGELRWFHCRSAPRPVASGQMVWDGIILDVTARKTAEADLARLTAESERRWRLYETALSNSLDFNFMFDLEGRFTYANESLLALWGKSRPEAFGKTPLELGYPTDLADRLLGQVRQAIDTRQPVRDETPFASRFGPREYEYNLVPVIGSGGSVEAVVGSAHDITDRKRAEAELRSSAERLVAALDASDTGTFRWNPTTGEFLEFDDRLKRLFGFRTDEPVRTTEDFLARVHPDDRPGLATAVAACREGADFEKEYRVVLPGGKVRWLYDRARMVRAADGEPVYLVGACTDITPRKRVEEEFRLSRERLDLVVNSVDVGLWYCDLPFDKLIWNAKVKEHFGLPADADVTIETFYERLHPDDRERTREAIEQSIQGHTPYDIEYRTVGLDGRERWVRAIGRTFYGPTGQPVHFDGITVDVTERVLAEHALKQSEERLETVLRATPTPIFIAHDRDCRHMTGNPAAFQAVKTPQGEIVSASALGDLPGKRPFREYRDGQPLPPDELPMQVAAREGVEVRGVELSFVFQDGDVRHFYGNAVPLRNSEGQVTGAIAAYVDITGLKQAQAKLLESEGRFRQLAEAMPQIVWVGDPQGNITYLNQHWHTTTGGTTEEGLGWAWGKFVHPDDLASVQGVWQSCVRSGRDYQTEYRLRRRDGVYRWQVVRGVPIRDEAGQVIRWYGSSTDIDEPKRLAESLREADRKKDEFLATLAHELRNPLAPLRNGLQVMKLAAGNAGAVEQARGMMERQMAVMVRLIDDLLDVSRITRGKLELRKERGELASVVQNAVEGSRPVIEASGHRLTVVLPPEPVLLDADPTRLAQVFSNLLANAAKYTDAGGHIRLTAERHGGEVVVSVKDTGIGIAAEHLPRLFEMFSQVKTALERSQGGLGIGLSLVKGLVEMHGGMVEARSEGLGKGSEFVVRLPVLRNTPAPETPQPGGEAEATSRTRRRILVADDNRDAADSLAMMLRLAGHEVYAVHDGQEAVEAVAWFRPDLALLDIGMPRLNGFDAARRIREQPAGEKVVLVAITGWGQEEDKRRASEAGFDKHLTKPVDPAALEKLLARLKTT